jgi:hypothetical protein
MYTGQPASETNRLLLTGRLSLPSMTFCGMRLKLRTTCTGAKPSPARPAGSGRTNCRQQQQQQEEAGSRGQQTPMHWLLALTCWSWADNGLKPMAQQTHSTIDAGAQPGSQKGTLCSLHLLAAPAMEMGYKCSLSASLLQAPPSTKYSAEPPAAADAFAAAAPHLQLVVVCSNDDFQVTITVQVSLHTQ